MDKPESTSEAASTVDECHIPDGIPEPGSTNEKEDEDGTLDDSSYMKMLRVITRGYYPTHYGHADSRRIGQATKEGRSNQINSWLVLFGQNYYSMMQLLAGRMSLFVYELE
ncbi:hypothetical protein Droror1_Dr00024056 [Drosera rotundifolia]